MKTLSLALPLVLASAVVAQEPTRMPEEYQKELSRYVGEWETESTIAGETQSGTFTATWAPGEPCLIYHYEVSDGSADTTVHGTGIIGWDYGAEQVKEVSFNSMG